LTDILIGNQVVGPIKMRRLGELARRAKVSVCVDDVKNIEELSQAARAADTSIGVLVEVDLGMGRCGVEPGKRPCRSSGESRQVPDCVSWACRVTRDTCS